MSFYFPRQKIYITVPYKNGATSALNFFVSVEKYLESKCAQLSELDSLEHLPINQDFGVHAKSGEFSAEPFRKLATKKNMHNADVSFFIIRDPYKRFSSFWHNRIMKGSDPYFGKIHEKLSAKYEFQNSSDVQKAAIDFLNDLARPFTKPITNGHLWPQIYLTRGKQYDFMIETDDLDKLPEILVDKSKNFRALKSLELPRLNVSANSEYPLLWNDEEKMAFAKSYAADDQFYEVFKSGKSNSPREIDSVRLNLYKEISTYGHVLNFSRNLAKKAFLF